MTDDVQQYRCFRCGFAQANGWVLQGEQVISTEIGNGAAPEKKVTILVTYRPYCRDCNTENRYEQLGVKVDSNADM